MHNLLTKNGFQGRTKWNSTSPRDGRLQDILIPIISRDFLEKRPVQASCLVKGGFPLEGLPTAPDACPTAATRRRSAFSLLNVADDLDDLVHCLFLSPADYHGCVVQALYSGWVTDHRHEMISIARKTARFQLVLPLVGRHSRCAWQFAPGGCQARLLDFNLRNQRGGTLVLSLLMIRWRER